MKTKLAFLILLTGYAGMAFGQENDDMYFNSKDRAKLMLAKPGQEEVFASRTENRDVAAEEESINPTDSYSARNVNPEFTARSKAEVARSDNEDYFNSNYHYNTSSELNSWNNNFASQYDNNWYHTSYWTPGMYSWNSPYYGNYYDPWANIWYSPYARSGWSSSFSFSYGNMWNGYSGWSMGYGYGNPYMMYNPYSYWYNPYSHWYNPYYGGGYPVVVRERDRSPYGKRNSRTASNYDRNNNGSGIGTRPTTTVSTANQRTESGSRMSSNTSRQSTRTTTTSRQPEYYNRTWRNQSNESSSSSSTLSNGSYDRSNSSSPSRSRSSDSGYTPTRSSNWNSGSSGSGNSSPSYTPSRSSGSSSGGGSRSSSGGGSSGGGSRSRGR